MAGSIVRFPGKPALRAVMSFPLSSSAADSLQRAIGESIELVDIRDADGSEGLVIVSSVSRQLLGKMRTAFPEATMFVVEVEDEGHQVDLGGPVMRALDAGAHGYLVARSVEELGEAITRAAAVAGEEAAASEAIALPGGANDHLHEILDAIILDRSSQRAPRAEQPSDPCAPHGDGTHLSWCVREARTATRSTGSPSADRLTGWCARWTAQVANRDTKAKDIDPPQMLTSAGDEQTG